MRASLVSQWLRIHLLMQETGVRSLGQKVPLENGMATHSSILAWEISWTEEPGGLQSAGSHRVRHRRGTKQPQQLCEFAIILHLMWFLSHPSSAT